MPTKLPLQKQKPLMSEPACLQAEAPSPRKREYDAPQSKNPYILQASILTRKVKGKHSNKFGFWCLQKSGFWREPQSEPQANLRVQKIQRKVIKAPDFQSKSGVLCDAITKRSVIPGLCNKSMLSPQPSGNVLSILIKQNLSLIHI